MLQHLHPKFSVITVTYNAGAVIEDTIQSVITQTYKNIEYIIVDGASTDKTMSIVNRYRERISVVVSEPDRGLYDAMNKGIRLATGDYLCFLNAGDSFHEDDTLLPSCTKTIPSTSSSTALRGCPNCPMSSTDAPPSSTAKAISCGCAASNRPKTLRGAASAKGCSSATRRSSPAATMPSPTTSATVSPPTSTGASA